jgi:hypothetical protein
VCSVPESWHVTVTRTLSRVVDRVEAYIFNMAMGSRARQHSYELDRVSLELPSACHARPCLSLLKLGARRRRGRRHEHYQGIRVRERAISRSCAALTVHAWRSLVLVQHSRCVFVVARARSVAGDRFWRARIEQEDRAARWHAKGKPAGGIYRSTSPQRHNTSRTTLPQPLKMPGTAYALMSTSLETPEAKKYAMEKVRADLGMRVSHVQLRGDLASERAITRWTKPPMIAVRVRGTDTLAPTHSHRASDRQTQPSRRVLPVRCQPLTRSAEPAGGYGCVMAAAGIPAFRRLRAARCS